MCTAGAVNEADRCGQFPCARDPAWKWTAANKCMVWAQYRREAYHYLN